jgi:hypothetical protein
MCFLSLIISDRVFHYRLRARCKQASPTRPVHELGISLGPYLGHNRLEESSVYNIVSTQHACKGCTISVTVKKIGVPIKIDGFNQFYWSGTVEEQTYHTIFSSET